MAGEAEKYLVARAQFERIHAEVTDLVEGMRVVFAALGRDPSKFAFANVAGRKVPPELNAGGDNVVVDAGKWQSPDQIMALLSRWREARETLRASWVAVPAEMQAGLIPPQAFSQIRRTG